MEVKQIASLINDVTKETIGDSVVVAEDLSNIVDVGVALENISDTDKYKNFLSGLVDRIGRTIFVNRKYSGSAPSVLMNAWEYGSIMQKVRGELPDAEENESWELVDGASYDENIYTGINVHAKFWNKRVTFEVPLSITDDQLKSAFVSGEEMNGFIEMLYNNVDKSLQVKVDDLIMRTINNMIGETIYDEYGSGSQTASSGTRAVNLLYLYNQQYGTSLTAQKALLTPEFIRYACYVIKLYSARLTKISKLFNIGETDKFTPKEYQHLVMLSEFKSGADVFLQSETFHEEFTKLPEAEEVAFWQGSGTDYKFTSTGKVDITTASGNAITCTGVLAVMFDNETLGVCNYKRKVTSKYNAKAEFTNMWYKHFAGYFNDLDENFVVFFIA